MKLTLFDLDHTLLNGDSDVLWCDFLIDKGLLERATFSARNADIDSRYKAGTVGLQEFADFYVGTLAGRTALEWEPLRQEFLATQIVPRITPAAIVLVDQHLDAGDLVVMTTATNRFLTELTAIFFGIEHLIATEPEIQEQRFTGRTSGTLNMREGKVERLQAWMKARGLRLKDYKSTAYSDSINDLPLLEAVKHPVAVNADAKLAAIAAKRSWPLLKLH
ncbi:HAD-superfamily subfamily IB hydrolase, TIGR01490 [Polaromonas sp. OV174]|uniref:HAD family hydrolase n=1 Tax=Polaromonas sp. OV174 TaxID=1855300 RepID=UPI0008E0B6E9|nr:HAD family hydrolase [Polaromonas sp. OV174]SFC28642.1 HAD-superfamily subfamily IB hydrolase, TIGR01490 [Polaromonas sp. OV174]